MQFFDDDWNVELQRLRDVGGASQSGVRFAYGAGVVVEYACRDQRVDDLGPQRVSDAWSWLAEREERTGPQLRSAISYELEQARDHDILWLLSELARNQLGDGVVVIVEELDRVVDRARDRVEQLHELACCPVTDEQALVRVRSAERLQRFEILRHEQEQRGRGGHPSEVAFRSAMQCEAFEDGIGRQPDVSDRTHRRVHDIVIAVVERVAERGRDLERSMADLAEPTGCMRTPPRCAVSQRCQQGRRRIRAFGPEIPQREKRRPIAIRSARFEPSQPRLDLLEGRHMGSLVMMHGDTRGAKRSRRDPASW